MGLKHQFIARAAKKKSLRDIVYGAKRDYPKIELFYDGVYVGTTTWSRTCKEAKRRFAKDNPKLNATKIRACFK